MSETSSRDKNLTLYRNTLHTLHQSSIEDTLKQPVEQGEGVVKGQEAPYTSKIDPTPTDNAALLSEYRDLYLQVGQSREKLAPLGTIHWYVPDSGYETGQVSTAVYQQRLKELYTSGDREKLRAGIEEMRRKLGDAQ